eukprot:1160125-Pelagomonas_calceolata.AAC.11
MQPSIGPQCSPMLLRGRDPFSGLTDVELLSKEEEVAAETAAAAGSVGGAGQLGACLGEAG